MRTGAWIVGVDLGGTWVRVRATDWRRRRSYRGRSPRLEGLPTLLRRLWRRWGLTRGRVAVLLVGARGIWTEAERRHLSRSLGRLARRLAVRSDAEAAHERAFGPRGSGILLAAGTGSIALGWTATRGRGRGWDGNGRWERAGGLGPLLGDEGSAFWIGREWLRATSRGTGLLHVRRLSRAPDAVARIAALAPSVLDRARRGDRVARRIVAEAQRHLAALLIETAERLRLLPPVPVSWTGGLLDDARFRAGVWREARRRGLRLRLTPPGNLERRLAALARRTPRTHR